MIYRDLVNILEIKGTNKTKEEEIIQALFFVMDNKHICLDLKNIKQQFEYLVNSNEEKNYKEFIDKVDTIYANYKQYKSIIEESSLFSSSNEQIVTPFKYRGDLIYTYRFHNYELSLLSKLNIIKKTKTFFQYNYNELEDYLSQFSLNKEQKETIKYCLDNQLTIVSGGPGTGKTYTISFLIKTICDYIEKEDLNIFFLAPTGKAVQRMRESFIDNLDNNIREQLNIDDKSMTIHRFIGKRDEKISSDIILIDEFSMVDIYVFKKFLDKITDKTKLIFIGDKNQLSSVEAGSIMSDLVNSSEFKDCVCYLEESRRFRDNSPIGVLSKYILNQSIDINKFDYIFKNLNNQTDFVKYTDYDKDFERIEKELELIILENYSKYIKTYNESKDIVKTLKKFNSFKILSSTRIGKRGVYNLNRFTEYVLTKNNLISYNSNHYCFQPIMITKNDYNVGLFNGDIGLLLLNKNGELKAFFQEGDAYKEINISTLPDYEKVFAMTVHKSQGSEFDSVLFFGEKNKVFYKELIYTALTRAKKQLFIYSNFTEFIEGVNTSIKRFSGLNV